MARPIRPATKTTAYDVEMAVAALRDARDILKNAGAPRAAAAVRKALKSAEGAYRHACHRMYRAAL